MVSVYVLTFLGATLYGFLTSLLYEFQAYDDTDLPCGVLRLQPKGGYGRHNGLVNLTVKSVMCLVIVFYLWVKILQREIPRDAASLGKPCYY